MLICMFRAPVTCAADYGCTLSAHSPLASAVMNIESSVLPSILQKKKESESKQGLKKRTRNLKSLRVLSLFFSIYLFIFWGAKDLAL